MTDIKDYAALGRKCKVCKKPLRQGAHYVDGFGPVCNKHAFQIQLNIHREEMRKL